MNLNSGSTNDSGSSQNFMERSIKSNIESRISKESGKHSMCPSLTIRQRVTGYAICTVAGIYLIK